MSARAEKLSCLRPKDAAAKLGYSAAAGVWQLAKADPTFPRPVQLASRTTVFLEHEIDAWVATKIAASRS